MSLAVALWTAAFAANASATDIGAGHALLSAWQLEDAQAIAQSALVLQPQSVDAWLLAARVQHARGEHLSALSLLAAAQSKGAVVDDEYAALLPATAAYAAHFSTLETAHFRIRYLNKDEIMANYAAPVLEAAYHNIGSDLGLLPAERGEKIAVEIYPSARGLADATGLTVKEIETSGTIAVCKFHRLMVTSALATANGYDWADTLAHELTHLIISKRSHDGIPIWLHEGIAKYYESRWKGAAGLDLQAYSEKLLAQRLRDNKLITFAQMHPSMAKLPSQEDAAIAFAEVFTVIEWIVKTYGPKAIPDILGRVGEGAKLETALQQVLKLDLRGVEKIWRRALEKRKFRIEPGAKPVRIELATSESAATASKPLETIEDRQAHDYARLGELLQLRGHHLAAVVEYEKAYRQAGNRYPTLLYRLAKSYQEAGKSDQALSVLQAGLGLHNDDADLELLAGRLFLERKKFAEAEQSFAAVRLQNPFNPEIHAALASLYDANGDQKSAALERHFLDLARKPRPTRRYDLPTPASGSARLTLISQPWGSVQIDSGATFAVPVVNQVVEAGDHKISWRTPDGKTQTKQVVLKEGQSETLILGAP